MNEETQKEIEKIERNIKEEWDKEDPDKAYIAYLKQQIEDLKKK